MRGCVRAPDPRHAVPDAQLDRNYASCPQNASGSHRAASDVE